MKPTGNGKGTGSGRLFVKNAAILTVTSLLLRGIGMYFRIWVSALVGAEGMGLYQLILSVYVLASGFASSGITVAVTRMTADELACGTRASLRGVLRRCVILSLAMGLLSALALGLLAQPPALREKVDAYLSGGVYCGHSSHKLGKYLVLRI